MVCAMDLDDFETSDRGQFDLLTPPLNNLTRIKKTVGTIIAYKNPKSITNLAVLSQNS
jgi:hypothetical protein